METIQYLWQCGKCGTSNPEDLIFCSNCATLEGANNNSSILADKTSKINEAMMGAINWSLQHGQFKASEVLSQAAQRGYKAGTLADLRSYPSANLDDLAASYVGSNRLGATGSGFVAGLPGGLVGFAAIPADVSAVIYFSLRSLSAISQAFSFETNDIVGQTVQLLAFAYASKLETLKIGQRRLETLNLAQFLLAKPKNGELYGKLVKDCALKQLARYLTEDFAKTSWATFLPVVGGVVNGTSNFMFVGEVSNRSRQFYRTLLAKFQPQNLNAPVVKPVVRNITTLAIIEVNEVEFDLLGVKLAAKLAHPANLDLAKNLLVLVLWEGTAGQAVAEKLAEVGLAALAPFAVLDAAHLQALLSLLLENHSTIPANLLIQRVGIVAFGKGATTALEIVEAAPGHLASVVLYNPVGPSRAIKTSVPTLLHWSSKTYTVDKHWPEHLQPAQDSAFVSAMEYVGVGFDFANPVSPDYNPKTAVRAWNETVRWLKANNQ